MPIECVQNTSNNHINTKIARVKATTKLRERVSEREREREREREKRRKQKERDSPISAIRHRAKSVHRKQSYLLEIPKCFARKTHQNRTFMGQTLMRSSRKK